MTNSHLDKNPFFSYHFCQKTETFTKGNPMMKMFAFFLCTVSVSLFGHASYERTISSINYQASPTGTMVAQIKLSDGSLWKWSPDAYSENLLRKWAEGDQIIVRTANHPGFILHNVERPHYMPIVSLNFNSYALFPSIVEISKDRSDITLSDGSHWELIYAFNQKALCEWTPGDRVIAVKGYQHTFDLINLDIPYENRCMIERSIQVAQSEHSPAAMPSM